MIQARDDTVREEARNQGDSGSGDLSHRTNRALPSAVGRLGEAEEVRGCLGYAEFEMSFRHPSGAAQEAGSYEPGVQESKAWGWRDK